MVNLGRTQRLEELREIYRASMREHSGLQSQMERLEARMDVELKNLKEAVHEVHCDLGIAFLFQRKD